MFFVFCVSHESTRVPYDRMRYIKYLILLYDTHNAKYSVVYSFRKFGATSNTQSTPELRSTGKVPKGCSVPE